MQCTRRGYRIEKMTEISTYKGDTLGIDLQVNNEDGTGFDLTGSTVYFTAKKEINDTDADAVIAYETTTDFSSTTTGLVEITIPATTMDALDGCYVYDIQVKFSDNTIFTPLTGVLVVKDDVTRGTA